MERSTTTNGEADTLESTPALAYTGDLRTARETLQEAESRAWKAETAQQAARTNLSTIRGTLQEAESRAWKAETASVGSSHQHSQMETELWQANTRLVEAESELVEVRAMLSQANERLAEQATRLRWLEDEVIPTKDAGLAAYAAAVAHIEALPPVRTVRRIQQATKRLGERLMRLSRLD